MKVFEIFDMEVNEENPKMRSMLKTDNLRAKRMKVWDVWYCILHIQVLFTSDSWHLVWGHSVHFAKFLMFLIFKRLLIRQFSFNSTKLYCKFVVNGEIKMADIWEMGKGLAKWSDIWV